MAALVQTTFLGIPRYSIEYTPKRRHEDWRVEITDTDARAGLKWLRETRRLPQ